MGKAKSAAIQPYKEGGLRSVGNYLGKRFGAEVHHVVHIPFQISQQLIPPFLAMLEGCHGGDCGEHVGIVEFVGGKP